MGWELLLAGGGGLGGVGESVCREVLEQDTLGDIGHERVLGREHGEILGGSMLGGIRARDRPGRIGRALTGVFSLKYVFASSKFIFIERIAGLLDF